MTSFTLHLLLYEHHIMAMSSSSRMQHTCHCMLPVSETSSLNW